MKKKIQKALFLPGLSSVFINPSYFTLKGLYDHIRKWASLHISGKTLDVGCGSKPYRSLFPNATEYIGMDIEESREITVNDDVDVFFDGQTFPFEDNSFDSIVCTEVLEHVFKPYEFLLEIHRVLKPGGKALLTSPFVWIEHGKPYDYARYTSFGLKHLVETCGFSVVKQEKSIPDIRAVFQMFNIYWYIKLERVKPFFLRAALNVPIIAVTNLMGCLFFAVLPKMPDLYLNNIIVVEKT
jgi:SAM-dependent methyltransferase